MAIFIVACENLIWPTYGLALLELAGSVYPGYHHGFAIASVISGTLYGLVDGAIGDAIFGWLYNVLARRLPGTVT